MRGESGRVPLLNVGLGGFVFSFVGAVLAVGVSHLFTLDGEYRVAISAIGATLVAMWGWLFRQDAVSGRDPAAGRKNLEEERIP